MQQVLVMAFEANLRGKDATWSLWQALVGDSQCIFLLRICAGEWGMGTPKAPGNTFGNH